jgi:hypothetical protein
MQLHNVTEVYILCDTNILLALTLSIGFWQAVSDVLSAGLKFDMIMF